MNLRKLKLSLKVILVQTKVNRTSCRTFWCPQCWHKSWFIGLELKNDFEMPLKILNFQEFLVFESFTCKLKAELVILMLVPLLIFKIIIRTPLKIETMLTWADSSRTAPMLAHLLIAWAALICVGILLPKSLKVLILSRWSFS